MRAAPLHRTLSIIGAIAVAVAVAIAGGAGARAQSLPPPPLSPAPVVALEYDAEGNPTRTIQAPESAGYIWSTARSYDRLNRLREVTDARAGTARLEYGGGDESVLVVDPRGLATSTPRNGFGDIRQLTSPDTGQATLEYDAAGNLVSRSDSRGVLTTYAYDALNRLVSASHGWGGQPPLVVGWHYDETGPGYSNGIGRLTSTTYHGGSSRYAYDAQGRLLAATQFTDVDGTPALALATRYGYDAAGRITEITYPSGRVLRIVHVDGRPAALTLAIRAHGPAATIVSQIRHEPYGAVSGWMWHLDAGLQWHERIHDVWGRIVRYPLGPVVRDLHYDAADRIAAYTHLDRASGTPTAAALALDQHFEYDELGRLTAATGPSGHWSYSYDANGNRTRAIGGGTVRDHTVDAGSNRLLALNNPRREMHHDAAGNTVADLQGRAGWTAEYDLANRLARLTNRADGSSMGYLYNAMGQRVARLSAVQQVCPPGQLGGAGGCKGVAAPATSQVYVYDQGGRLLGEYGATDGTPLREYLWLEGTPVAVLTYDPSAPRDPVQLHHIHADHLDTPRVIVDRAGAIRWTWSGEPFGASPPDADPGGLGPFTFSLRFPGQYFDPESGTSDNHFRNYDASVGRYVQSDPIGLAGGINTYIYANGAPLSFIDPDGLDACVVSFPDMPIEYADGKTSTWLGGHAGALGYDSVGVTRYYEYGRYKPNSRGTFGEQLPAAQGNFRRIGVPNLKIGPDGHPTPESLSALKEALSREAGKGAPATLTCDKDADERKVYEYLEQLARDKNRRRYSWNPLSPNQCRTVARDAVRAGRP